MADDQIVHYIELGTEKGLPKDQISGDLKKYGYEEVDIILGFAAYEQKIKIQSPPPPIEAVKTAPVETVVETPVIEEAVVLPAVEKKQTPQFSSSRFFPIHILSHILSGSQKIKLLLLTFILAFVITIKPTYILFSVWYPIVHNLPKRVLTFIDEIYPKELAITVKNGIASTNVTEPYFITVPKEAIETLLPIDITKRIMRSNVRLLTINTKALPEDFMRYGTYVLLTQKELVYYGDNGIKTYRLSSTDTYTISKQTIIDKYNQINPQNKIGNMLNILIWCAPPLIFLSSFLSLLLTYLSLTFLSFIMTKLNMLTFHFGTLYRYCAAVMFVPALCLALVGLLPFVGTFFASFTSLQIVMTLSLTYLGIYFYKNNNESHS